MNTQDFLNEIVVLLTTRLDLPVPFSFERLSCDRSSLAIQSNPSIAEGNYHGSRTAIMTFNILSKSRSRYEANLWLDNIANELNKNYIEVVQEPNFLGVEDNSFIYVATFRKRIRRY